MPELIQNGPDIPVELMNKLDDGRVVFFCGAGISMGTGLPSFRGLVEHVYEVTKEAATPLEQNALDKSQLDKALGLIEGRLIPGQLRQGVIERLSISWTGSLDIHQALLTLSRTKAGGSRLVTTNFDNRFAEAGADERLIDAAPKLPIPKNDAWGSLVHLHGRIVPADDGRSLVLTAADFGRAYLTERWAARFITELFREFTVIFVGYSLDDPVMGYMVDALAAERARGANFGRAYAFASFQDDRERETAKIEWKGKNVEPILYRSANRHELLNKTLIEWARIHTDPIFSRKQIALNEIKKAPAGSEDPSVRRLCWALSDAATAQELARSTVVTEEADYPVLAAWIHLLDEAGFLSWAEGHGTGDATVAVPIADAGLRSQRAPNLATVTRHLAWWVARHAHVPQVLDWVVRKGAHPHPQFADMIRDHLARPETPIPPTLRLLWTVVIGNQWSDDQLWHLDQFKRAGSEGEKRQLIDDVLESVLPRLVVQPGPSSYLQLRRIFDKTTTPLTPLETCGHTEIALGAREISHGAEEILKMPDVLVQRAWQLTSHLERAIDLIKQDDGFSRSSISHRPSIADHPQNRHRPDWTQLIDWVRDSYFALKRKSPGKAFALLIWWGASTHPLFQRLVLHAITEDRSLDPALAKSILLNEKKPGLWDMELNREVLRFFRLAGRRMSVHMRSEIIKAIKAGPRPEPKKKQDREHAKYEISLRLRKLAAGGVKLDKATKARISTLPQPEPDEAQDRDEFLTWSGDARFVSKEEQTSAELVATPITDLAEKIKNEAISAEGLEGIALKSPLRAIAALRRLGKEGVWPGLYWQRLFWGINGLRHQEKLNPKIDDFLLAVLDSVPEAVFSAVGSSVAGFVENVSKKYPIEGEERLSRIWLKAWSGISHVPEADSKDVMTDAINHAAGKLAEAALQRLWMRKPLTGQELPPEIEIYFERIAKTPAGTLGRAILASRLFHLFGVAPKWTAANLLPFMSWDRPEAKTLWLAYAWSPTIGPNLLAALKEDFLEALRQYSEMDDAAENLVGLFVSICLEAPHELTVDEVDGVVKGLPENGLVEIVDRLAQRLKGTPDEQAALWRDKIAPWLRDYWPRSSGRNTSATSRALVEVARQSGSAFPDAVDLLTPYLKPVAERILWHIEDDGLAAKWPDKTFALLAKIVSRETLKPWERPTLRKILDKLQEVSPTTRSKSEFQTLYKIATQ